jgi:protein-tyrosine phosphatase
MARVLFVCLGNICRSPTAHGVFEAQVRAAGMADRVTVDSAGTGAWHVGRPPDGRTRRVALQRGYDLSHLRARQVCAADFYAFDYLLAMDEDNLAALRAMRPDDSQVELRLFLDYARDLREREVPDPYYGGAGGFERVFDLVERAAAGLLAHLRQTGA